MLPVLGNRNEKLVRDNIPDILGQEDKSPVFRICVKADYPTFLQEKLYEEAMETIAVLDKETTDRVDLIEELADVLEVIDAIVEHYGINKETLKVAKETKLAKKGKFLKRIIMKTDSSQMSSAQ